LNEQKDFTVQHFVRQFMLLLSSLYKEQNRISELTFGLLAVLSMSCAIKKKHLMGIFNNYIEKFGKHNCRTAKISSIQKS
jgi:hypothetical protein